MNIHAQNVDSDSLKTLGYYFPEFKQGVVLLKNGKTIKSLLNYNCNEQNFAFLQNNQYLLITNIDEIDTVYVDNIKFIAIAHKFFEVIPTDSKEFLFVNYKSKKTPLEKTTNHNGTIEEKQDLNSNTVSNIYVLRKHEDAQYSNMFIPFYYLKRQEKLYKVNNKTEIIKAFPAKSNEIDSFIRSNHIEFKKVDEMVKLINYCNS